MTTQDIHDTLYSLSRQFPSGATTYSTCSRCGTAPARGRGACVACLEQELIQKWGAPKALVDILVRAHAKARDAYAELEDVRETIVKAARG